MIRAVAVALVVSMAIIMFPGSSFALNFGLRGGAHIPTGDYGDIANTAFAFGLHFKLPVSPNSAAGLHLGYSKADGKGTLGRPAVEIDDVVMTELYLFWDYYAFRQTPASMFLRGGLGVNRWEIEGRVRGAMPDELPIYRRSKEDDIDLMIAVGPGVILYDHFEIMLLYNRILTGDFDEGYVTATIGYNFLFGY